MEPSQTQVFTCSNPSAGDPPRDGTSVWVWSIRLDATADETRASERFLSIVERRRADRFQFDRDRIRFIVRRAALRLLLAQYLDGEPGSLTFTDGPHGKPSLASPF